MAGTIRSSASVSLAILSSRVLGVARDSIFARVFGVSALTDAYVAAFRIPNLLRDLFAEGALSSAFVPTFSDALAKGGRERSRQRALLFYWKKEEAPHVREALMAWGRKDLIGRHPGALVDPGPAFGAWSARAKRGSVRYDTHMGMKVERASKSEEQEESWEAVAEAR